MDFGIEGSVTLTGVTQAKQSLTNFKQAAKEAQAAVGELTKKDVAAIKTLAQLQGALNRTAQAVERTKKAEESRSAQAKLNADKIANQNAISEAKVRTQNKKTHNLAMSAIQERARRQSAFQKQQERMERVHQEKIRQEHVKTSTLIRREKSKLDQMQKAFSQKSAQQEAIHQERLRREIMRTNAAKERSIKVAKEQTTWYGRLGSATSNAISVTSLFRTALISLTAAFSFQKFLDYIDVIVKMRAATGLYNDSAQTAAAVQEKLFDVANNSRASIEQTIALYQRLSLATRNMEMTTGDTLKMVERIQKAIRLSGSTYREAAAAAMQFSQGVASGNLQGDELRSVRENAPFLAAALEDFANRGKEVRKTLKQMGADGELTAELIANAFNEKTNPAILELEKRFDSLPFSLADAFNKFSTEMARMVKDLDETRGIIGLMAGAVSLLADSLSLLSGALGIAAMVGLARFAKKALESKTALAAYAAVTQFTAKAQAAQNVASMKAAAGLGVVGGAAAKATVSMGLFARASSLAAGAMGLIGGRIGLALLAMYGVAQSNINEVATAQEGWNEKLLEAQDLSKKFAMASRERQTEIRTEIQLTIDAAKAEKDRLKAIVDKKGKSNNPFGLEKPSLTPEWLTKVNNVSEDIADSMANAAGKAAKFFGIIDKDWNWETYNEANQKLKKASENYDAVSASAERVGIGAELAADGVREFSEAFKDLADPSKVNLEYLRQEIDASMISLAALEAVRRGNEIDRKVRKSGLTNPDEVDAYRMVITQIKEYQDILKKNDKALRDKNAEKEKNIRLTQQQAEKLREYEESLAISTDQSERLLEASKLGIKQYEQTKLKIEAENEVLRQNVALSSAKGQELLKQIEYQKQVDQQSAANVDRFREEEREAKRRAGDLEKLMNEPYRRAAENIQDAFSDMFQSVFREGIDGFGDFADRIKDIMLTMVAEIAAAMVFRPILGDVIGSAMGGGQGASGGGGGIFSNLSSLSDLTNLTNLSSLTKPIFSGSGTIGSSINSIGNFFGLGGTAQGPTLAGGVGVGGPVAQGAAGYSYGIGDLNNLINPANILASFAGSQLADMFGLSGKYSGIGSMAGSIGGSIAGASIGASMGTILGFAGGPAGALIGTLLGSFGGSALGGLFGGKPSDKGQFAISDFAGSIVQEGGLEGKKFSQENRDIAKQFASLGGSIAAILSDIDGVEQSFNQVQVKIGNRDGSFAALMQDGQAIERIESGSSGSELLRSIIDGILNNTTGLPSYIESSLRNLNIGEDFDQALADIQFIAGFEQLINGFGVVEDEMTQTEQVMEQLEEAIKNARIEVERLGLPLDKFNEGIERAYATMRQQINEGLANQLLAGQSDYFSGYIAEIERHENAMKDAKATGADLNIVMAIHEMNMRKLEVQYGNQVESLNEQINIMQDFTDTAERLGDALYNIMVGPTSILGPIQQLEMARSEFQDLFQTAMGGGEAGMEAAESLSAVGEQLIELSKSYFGSSDEVAGDFQNVIDSIKTVQDFYKNEGSGVQEIIDQRDKIQGQAATSVQPNAIDVFNQNKQAILSSGLLGTVNEVIGSATGTRSTSFNASTYLGANPDVAAAASSFGGSADDFARNHYNLFGINEGRDLGINTAQASASLASNEQLNRAVYSALQQIGVPGFANGGFAPAGKPFVVGEQGPELLSFGRPAYITPNVPANDNSAVMAGFMQMIQAQQAQTAVMREGFNQLISEQRRAAQAAEETSKAQKRRSAA